MNKKEPMQNNDDVMISVVMACKNEEQYIKLAIASILEQTFKNFEFIIVNDGSDDATECIISDYMNKDPRIKMYKNNVSVGLTSSLVDAIKLAKGKYIARQDADDISVTDRLQKQLDYLDNNLDYSVIGSCIETIDENGSSIKIMTPVTGERNASKHLRYGNIFSHGSVMFRKYAYEIAGGYNLNYKVAQDFDLWLRMSKQAKVNNLPEVLYYWRVNDKSISAKRKNRQVTNVLITLTNNYYNDEIISITEANNLTDEEAFQFTADFVRRLKSKELNKIIGISMLRMGYLSQGRSFLLKTKGIKLKFLSIFLINRNLFGFLKNMYIKLNKLKA